MFCGVQIDFYTLLRRIWNFRGINTVTHILNQCSTNWNYINWRVLGIFGFLLQPLSPTEDGISFGTANKTNRLQLRISFCELPFQRPRSRRGVYVHHVREYISPGFVALTNGAGWLHGLMSAWQWTALLMQWFQEMTDTVHALPMYSALTPRWFSPRRKLNLLYFGSPSFQFSAPPSPSQSYDHIPVIRVQAEIMGTVLFLV
jgi:hypothetical protein